MTNDLLARIQSRIERGHAEDMWQALRQLVAGGGDMADQAWDVLAVAS